MLTVMFGLCLIFWSVFVFFFFKQKTAYEMRISDWSSDVCSSDLPGDIVDQKTGCQASRHGHPARGAGPLRDERGAGALFDIHADGPGAAGCTLRRHRQDALVRQCPVTVGSAARDIETRDRMSTRLNSSHYFPSRFPSSSFLNLFFFFFFLS